MKRLYTLFLITVIGPIWAQNYDFGLIHLGGYDFKIVAIPDFDSSGNTDLSDAGFTLMLPAGASDVVNANSLLAGRTWSSTEFDAAFLSGLSLGDGTRDAFQLNMPPGQSLFSHTSGQQIDLVAFQISNMPSSGQMTFLLNSDPIAAGAGGVLDSFYNSNIDNTSSQDYFNSPAPGLDSFSFDTLSIEELNEIFREISVYPNPTSGILTIETNTALDSIELFDILGKRLMEIPDDLKQIDMSDLPVGVYLLVIEQNTEKYVKRIIRN
ncbi:MAG: T9SS type A sorting domain-containing protein [Flavobacteriaceae bacterium]|nr:T9SS type A sorting domain-containing protein [Flavobacteriaceae bacterium]